jgi:hypothetical protein
MKYHFPPDFGYYETKNGRKQGIKLLTGEQLANVEFPEMVEKTWAEFAKEIDSFSFRLAGTLAKEFFGYLTQSSTQSSTSHKDSALMTTRTTASSTDV